MTIRRSVVLRDGVPEAAPPPDGRPLLTVSSYDDAVVAIDTLAEARFPVRHVTVVGRGVRKVDDAAGRGEPARAVASATLAGGGFGLISGLLFDWWGALAPDIGAGWLAFYGFLYGALAGLLVALSFSQAGHRDFASVRTLDADHYELVLTGGERAQALHILHGAGLV